MKRCSKCRSVKAVEAFHKQAAAKDGLQSHCKACQLANAKTPAGKEWQRKGQAKYRAEYPDKEKAHTAVNEAVRAGHLDSASALDCLHCGGPAQEWHHWFGYAKAFHFWILPLCRRCHVAAHKTPLSTPSLASGEVGMGTSVRPASFVHGDVRL